MANHYTRQIPDLSEAQRQQLQRWVRRSTTCSSAGLAGADRAGDGRRQERPGGSRRTGHDPWYRRKWRRAVSARRLRWLTGRAATGSAAHDWGRTTWSGWWCKPWRRSRQVLRIGARASMAKACGLSAATVSRIWRAFGLKPHRCEPSSCRAIRCHREGTRHRGSVPASARARGGVVRGREAADSSVGA